VRSAREPSELRSQRDGARRAIPWEKLDAAGLDVAKRTLVGKTWRERMRQEHLAVGAFAMLAQELAEIGCDPIVLSLVTRASADEVRHAEVCRRVAVALLGASAVPARFRGLPKIPAHVGATRETRALLHVVEMCCLSETLTGVYFTEMLARATNEGARAVLESLLEDEIDHGRVGWAYLADRARTKSTDGLAAALPQLLERTVGRALIGNRSSGGPDDRTMEAFGYIGGDTSAEIFRRTLRDVIFPGFETLGVDIGPGVAVARSGGWV
jgi:hypothetical protein